MMYIDNSKIPVAKWRIEERRLTNILAGMQPAERSLLVNRKRSCWVRYKRKLERLSNGKCWYCEVKLPRSHFSIDHYRPKNLVRGADGRVKLRSGYWWLAFDPRNFRLACDFCNAPHKDSNGVIRGKSDCFPLLNDSRRARSPKDDLQREIPLLLDPTNPADPMLLLFRDDGNARPFYKKRNHRPYERATFTIELLDLNSTKLRGERKDVYRECRNLLDEADSAFKSFLLDGDEKSFAEFQKKVRDMRKRTSPASEYSATARNCLLGSGYDWAQKALMT